MPESTQPYAGPADDGGDQGAFTVPSDSAVAPNAANPEDRNAAGSLWSPGAAPSKPERGGRWPNAVFTLLTLLVIGSVFVLLAYCNVPR